MKHTIADIRYQGVPPGIDGTYLTAPVICSCGWTGALMDFQPHRRAEREAEPPPSHLPPIDRWANMPT